MIEFQANRPIIQPKESISDAIYSVSLFNVSPRLPQKAGKSRERSDLHYPVEPRGNALVPFTKQGS
jgi:hypothetical protein